MMMNKQLIIIIIINKPRIVPWGTEKMRQRIQRHRRATLSRLTQPQREQDQTKKYCYGMDWLQKKAYDMVPQNWIIDKMYYIRLSRKLYLENHENLESGIDSRRENLSWNKYPKRYIPRRCTITIIIYKCDDDAESHTQKRHCQIQTQ